MPRGESYNFAAEAERLEKQKREREQMIETLAPSDSTQKRLARLKQWLEDEQERAESGKEWKFSFFRKRGSALEAAKRGRALSALRDLLNRAEDAAGSPQEAQKWLSSAMIEAMRLGYAHVEKDKATGAVKVVYEEKTKETAGKKSKGKKKRAAKHTPVYEAPKAAPTAVHHTEVVHKAEVIGSESTIEKVWKELEPAPGNNALKEHFEFKITRDLRGVKATMSLKEEYQSAQPFQTLGVGICLGTLKVSVATPQEMKEFADDFSKGFDSPDIQKKVSEVAKSLPAVPKKLTSDSIETLTKEIGEKWVGAVIALIEHGTEVPEPAQETDKQKYEAFMETVGENIKRHLAERGEFDDYTDAWVVLSETDVSFDNAVAAVCEALKQDAPPGIDWEKENRGQSLAERVRPLAQARCAEKAMEIIGGEGKDKLDYLAMLGKNIANWDALTEEGRTSVTERLQGQYEAVYRGIADKLKEWRGAPGNLIAGSCEAVVIVKEETLLPIDNEPSPLIDIQKGIYVHPVLKFLERCDFFEKMGAGHNIVGKTFPLYSLRDI